MTTTPGVDSSDPTQYTANNGGLGNIGKSDFLKLLTAQLQNQDPMKPSSQEEMVATLAQFTALEQSAHLVEQMTTLSKSNAWNQGVSLMGRTVQALDDAGASVSGTVSGLRWDGDALRLRVGTADVALANLVQVLS
ncbi:MAG TPA: flagellar hook capping FlgD N-terminal domain-containing protein [Elusimicrobiota bacterium]|jgi:flagellar basal-body rod modification protein FlgD|nr:flagellar hook capping FlgD N-terminal domain-containing protein [Elusimicrobiota bacterium]HMZ26350.1 flagellar hook capping FlgD N-terminal domain-containing protein [Elusimicrobiota bacterium]HNA60754.1 flagellar hook capping FlgD N-terminal domain-containing protein [Elusimicrobiota bacterium]HNC74025.1 flagellar hook capping FlgD N-terminal domain-containing protein [Elusimicrobiota bacterium]HND63526.1 flagellar hook capping FlgD N-terminal domain-containing protein [Elusimicrobiota ba